MTAQVSQIYPSDPGLFQDYSAQNKSEGTFQRYLDEEQKRLALLFSAWGQFNLDSWFTYPDLIFSDKDAGNRPPAESETPANQYSLSNYPTSNKAKNSISSEPLSAQHPFNNYNATSIRQSLQEILNKTGWLIPNLEASPLFFQANLEGKLLSKLDLQSLVDKILSQVKMVKEKGKVELSLGLKPENLGEILLTLTSRSGMISIQIQAPAETRKLLEEELGELELALKKAKVNLAEIKIHSIKEENKNV